MLASVSAGAAPQTTPANAAFDVATIKSSAPGLRGYSIRPLHDRLLAHNVTLKLLIGDAYDFQVSGGPKWIDSDRHALAVRQETKEMPAYVLETEKGVPRSPRPSARIRL